MTPTKAVKSNTPVEPLLASLEAEETEAVEETKAVEETEETEETASLPPEPVAASVVEPVAAPVADIQQIDDIFSSLKILLSTVEKLQKARQEVGDIKALVLRLLDGEMISGDDLEQLKIGVNGLSRLLRIHSDYQAALEKAQPARDLLDQVLK